MAFFSNVKKHIQILSKAERKQFAFILSICVLSSLMDIFGIGFVGYFLLIIMNPQMIAHIPVLGSLFASNDVYRVILPCIGGIVLLLFLCKTVIGCLTQKVSTAFAFRVGARIRYQLMTEYLAMPYEEFVSGSSSDIINNIFMGVNNYASQNLGPLILILTHSIFVSMVLVFLFILNPVVTLCLMGLFGSVLIANAVILKKKLHKIGMKIHVTNEHIIQSIREAFSMFKELRVLGKTNYFLAKMQKEAAENASAYASFSLYQRLPLYFIESTLLFSVIALCVVELYLGMNSEALVALCGILVSAGARLFPSVYQIATSIVFMQGSAHHLTMVYDSVKREAVKIKKTHAMAECKTAEFLAKKDFVIRLQNITYRYPGTEKDVLKMLDMEIHAGQSIGVIGVSGAGKSTLIEVLLGLLPPTSGSVTLNSKDLPASEVWMKRFAYIPQTIALLEGTIQENITLSDEDIDNVALTQAIAMAKLEEVVTALPLGLHTHVGDNGIKLSGGQRQRIALARAFYHDRDIIILDEATSALDHETEKEVVDAIVRLQGIKTLIIIAHRHSTIVHCDKIYKLDAGCFVSSGSFQSVVLNE